MKSAEFMRRCVSGQVKRPAGEPRCFQSIVWDGDVVYSYGSHYPLLVPLETKAGRVWVLNDSGYSVTTSKHIGWAGPLADYRVELHKLGSLFSYNAADTARAILQAATSEIERRVSIAADLAGRIEKRPKFADTYRRRIENEQERIAKLHKLAALAAGK